MVGSEVYSTEVKKTEVLAEAFRRAIGTFDDDLVDRLSLTLVCRSANKGDKGSV